MGKVHGQKSPAGTGAQKKGGFERFSVCGAAKGYLPVVDFAKGLAIIGVLLLHFFTETKAQLSGFWLSFHEAGMPVLNLAVPAFVFLMAFNMAYALGIKPRSLVQYFKGRALRLLPAFLVAFFASLFFWNPAGASAEFRDAAGGGLFPCSRRRKLFYSARVPVRNPFPGHALALQEKQNLFSWPVLCAGYYL